MVENLFKNFENIVAAVTDDEVNIVFICYNGPGKTKGNLEKTANDMQSQYSFHYTLPELFKKFVFISPEQRETWIAKIPVLS